MFSVKPPKIKTRTVSVPVKKTPTPAADRPARTTGNGIRKASATAAPPTNRYSLTPSTKARSPTSSAQSREPARKSLSVSRIQQRKRKVTPTTPQWASSDESSDGEDDLLSVRKRQKLSSSIEPMNLNRCLEPDYKRRIRRTDANEDRSSETGANGAATSENASHKARLISGLNMSSGDLVKKFKPAFYERNAGNLIVELQYPSSSKPEKFETVVPIDASDFNPLDDIYFTVDEIIQHYLPPDLSTELASDSDGTVRLLKRAVKHNTQEDFAQEIKKFNRIIKDNVDNGTVAGMLDGMHALPLSLVRRILAQVYQRTVSFRAHNLRKVTDKSTTYGELLPTFVHTIFQQTGLNSQSVFVDLGSGVGNVVLQSALQTGAESWGIEILKNPAEYADDQASELRARAKLWDLFLGLIHLLHGSFLESPQIDDVLRRADVVLVNNKVFPQKLNNALLDKFLDLKDGCKVVSLASFGGGGKQGVRNENSIANLFEEERHDSGTNSVSWAIESVEYFIATKRPFGS